METLSFGIRAERNAPSLRHISARIHAHVGGARVDVVTFPDQNGESGKILLQIFHSDGTEEGRKE